MDTGSQRGASRTIDIQAGDGSGTFSGYLALPRAGKGPGIVLLQEIFGVNDHIREVAELYAAEGYVVLAPDMFWRLEPGVQLGYGEEDFQRGLELRGRLDLGKAAEDIAAAVAALRARPECAGKIGALGFCLGGRLAVIAAAAGLVDGAVSYYGVGIETMLDEAVRAPCPMALHFAGADRFVPPQAVARIRDGFAARHDVEIHEYPGVDHGFNCDQRPAYDKPAAMMAHSRSIALFRRVMGPHYNLSALWDKHCEYEFGLRDVDATMATMVPQPYVNHIPTMTGGVGYTQLHRFYKNHFVNSNPADTTLIPISRTVGADRVVDEMLFCFTHDREIDWMLPGIPPTGRRVEIPLVAIVSFRGDKLYNEHIYWDQASVLVQIGLLKSDGLPVAGIETARKLLDEKLPSNGLMRRWAESEGK